MVQTCSAIEFYTGGFSRLYDDFVASGYLPNPASLFHLSSRFLAATAPFNLLDVGIGSGLSSLPFQRRYPHLNIHGVDGSWNMLYKCGKTLPNASLRPLDCEKEALPYSTESFDIVISQGTLYLLKNSVELIADMARVTRKGGLLAFNIEASPDECLRKRFNDATLSRDDQRQIITYQHPLDDILTSVRQSGLEILTYKERLAMQKTYGQPIYFTDIVAKKL